MAEDCREYDSDSVYEWIHFFCREGFNSVLQATISDPTRLFHKDFHRSFLPVCSLKRTEEARESGVTLPEDEGIRVWDIYIEGDGTRLL